MQRIVIATPFVGNLRIACYTNPKFSNLHTPGSCEILRILIIDLYSLPYAIASNRACPAP